MPLVTCPDCQGRISDAAPACVHCGRPAGPARPALNADGPPTRRRHPLAGPAAGSGIPLRGVLRGLAVASVAGLVGVRWVYGGRWEGMDLLLSALIPIAIGASLLLMEPPEATAVRTRAGRRRGNWGVWFSEREARREFHWNVVAGWAFLLIGAVTLLASAL